MLILYKMFQVPVLPFHNDRVVDSREEPIFEARRQRCVFGSIASETLFEPSNSDTAVVDVIFVQSLDYFGNDVTLTCPDNWRRSVLIWHTGELRGAF